jgi:hypothetical protein
MADLRAKDVNPEFKRKVKAMAAEIGIPLSELIIASLSSYLMKLEAKRTSKEKTKP